jgi:aryl-alcohol dehydrogenase-like predicted oxidoreductase
VIAHNASKLALGGAQFGMRYGIVNSSGQPPYSVVEQIFRKANKFGISMVDTAHAYGNSEAILGRVVGQDFNIRIVTKTRPIRNDAIEQIDIESVKEAFDASLQRLNRSKIYGLLVHNAGDLLASGGERLWAWMESVKSAGKVEKIGVSVYSPEQLRQLLLRHPNIELVQLPFNIYDQRFAQLGILDLLKSLHIEVHSRSAFLQGLLLMAPDRLPNQFEAIRRNQADLHDWLSQRGLSPLAGALAISVNDPRIDIVVVGCESLQQFDDILSAVGNSCPHGLGRFAIPDENIINPSLWMNGN